MYSEHSTIQPEYTHTESPWRPPLRLSAICPKVTVLEGAGLWPALTVPGLLRPEIPVEKLSLIHI